MLRKILTRMLHMCPLAWYVSIRCLQLCCFLLLCAGLLLAAWNGHMLHHYDWYMTALALNETAQAVLLIGILFPVIIEDLQS